MDGYIHSIQTMGAVDGPGLRYVIFTSGCPLRCKYCHNPDTWKKRDGKIMSVEEILDDYEDYRPFLTNGGITVSGGEPLIQLDFLISLLSNAKKRDIHTCIDTSGATYSETNIVRKKKFEELIKYTDLVLLDLKHIDEEKYYKLTKGNLSSTKKFLEFLNDNNIDVWIRHVLLKGITYDQKQLYDLGYYIGQFKNVKSIDILPYHTMGVDKYKVLGLTYPLKDMPALTPNHAINARKIVEIGIRDKILGLKKQL